MLGKNLLLSVKKPESLVISIAVRLFVPVSSPLNCNCEVAPAVSLRVLVKFDVVVAEDMVVLDKPNPPMVPAAAVTLPAIVTLPLPSTPKLSPIATPLLFIANLWVEPSFNSKPEPEICMCSFAVTPICVVDAKFATPSPLCETVNPAELNFAKLSES